ncbi:alanine--glyoxylate aminotransferase family protein [Oxalobacter vibrioformis]|uniref:Alanine--glyoxylate aminotransferase family protein n=1 Tax=Oxalobacter vibrioformis TaxID=933080 RepID=A0A9E9P5E2_9BURK|nr:alanine--glyoxylate aminotransferase family protein [Oxalobacter vibrioformis]NLC23345.1 alanine--glyoxylate aminotransferase family protein [Oxalobacter sp.]WAW11011.1 alanine--glyoxylate aminotransferase family protein [Oxalobacter vibrioformis]
MVAPSLDKITSFTPPQRTLMGPGPSNINPRVLSAMSLPVIGHLDPAFAGMMEELKVLLRYGFQTKNPLTYPISGPGSVGMENCFVNMVSPGDKVIVCRNGVFGGRMIENVERSRGIPVIIDDTWGEPVDPNKVEDALKKNPDARIVAFVHAETSTGCESDAKLLAQIAHKHDAMVIVDTVTSLGGCPVLVDEWELDAVYSGTQKCLSCAPGLSPVTFSERAVDYVTKRKDKVQSWFMDLNLILNYWGNTARTYHHTAPVNALYGLHEAMVMVKEEGLENAWARHTLHHQALKAGFDVLGLQFVVKEESRLPQMNLVTIPEGIDEAAVRQELLNEFNLEIGAGLGPLAGKVWRVGLMGYTAQKESVILCLSALGSVLARKGYAVNAGAAEAAALKVYAAQK